MFDDLDVGEVFAHVDVVAVEVLGDVFVAAGGASFDCVVESLFDDPA